MKKCRRMAKQLLPQLVDASKKTVADYQPVINKQGVGFKGFIPATFGTQAAAKFSAKTGLYLKQTTVDGLLRNPKNKADEFEAAAEEIFRCFLSSSGRENHQRDRGWRQGCSGHAPALLW